MFEDTRSEKVETCLCLDEEASSQLAPLTEPVELDDADLDAVVGGVVSCSSTTCSTSRSIGTACCSS